MLLSLYLPPERTVNKIEFLVLSELVEFLSMEENQNTFVIKIAV